MKASKSPSKQPKKIPPPGEIEIEKLDDNYMQWTFDDGEVMFVKMDDPATHSRIGKEAMKKAGIEPKGKYRMDLVTDAPPTIGNYEGLESLEAEPPKRSDSDYLAVELIGLNDWKVEEKPKKCDPKKSINKSKDKKVSVERDGKKSKNTEKKKEKKKKEIPKK
ncbi:hypothetical protein CRE_22499 [Caenorhabditis remanei]|uniref:Uncharacterized protein n=1 Tax=Caenorhabditis remanei TaxID=31234 RepID=E3MU37_CAERE|nr:hypothetical protein CRE_22499 [Caenorhabditis remanei]